MSFTMQFDSRVVSIKAVQKAAYRVAKHAITDVRVSGLNISLTVTPTDTAIDVVALEVEVSRHVLDYSLREKIGNETADIRNLILSTAFSRIIEQNSEGD
jgi:His-Xaa-Ser system protein HxsD